MSNIPIIVTFFAGIVSFLSPCVLPIIPGFLAYLAGGTSSGNKSSRWETFLSSFFFVLGFSVVFAVLGVLLNGVLAHSAYEVQKWLSWIGGALVIFFGLYLMGFFRVPFFEYNHSFKIKILPKSRHLTSMFFGFAFAAGWTPCVGAVLGSVLGLAAAEPGQALYLLFAYALGLGIPFLIVGLFATEAGNFLNRYSSAAHYINIVFGLILVALGVLVFTQSLPLVANFGFVNSLLLK